MEKGNAKCINELDSVTKKYNNTIHHSTIVTPIQASKIEKEKQIYFNLHDKRQKRKPKHRSGDLVRTAYKTNFFAKGDSTNCTNKLYTTEVIDDTIQLIE